MRRRTFLLGAMGALGARAQTQESLGTLAYVQRSGLWIKELPGGAPRQIASGPDIEQPRFSPSGGWISYQKGSYVNLVSEDGATRKRWFAYSSRWIPPLDELAVKTAPSLVRVFGAQDGWKAPKLSIHSNGLPIFSRDGSICAFLREVDESATIQVELYLQKLRAGAAPRLLQKAVGQATLYSFSGDGQLVLYWHADEVSASLAADGLGLFSINIGGNGRDLGCQVLIHDELLAISPLTNKLALTDGFGRETWTGKRIAVVDLSSVNQSRKPSVRYVTNPSGSAMFPAWSPDSSKLAYTSAPDAEFDHGLALSPTINQRCVNGRRIWVASISPQGTHKQITDNRQYHDELPLWSRTGSHILFCRMDRKGAQTIWLMKADGSEQVQVAGPLHLKWDELTGSANGWFGKFYGYMPWPDLFDWWRGTPHS